MAKLKTLPKAIIALVIVAGAGFGINTYLEKKAATAPVAAAPTLAPTPTPAPAPAPSGLGSVFSSSPPAPTPTPQIVAPAVAYDSLQNILSSGVVRVGVQSPAKPFFYTEGGQAHGFNVEFMKILFAQPAFEKAGSIKIDTSHTVDEYDEVPKTLLKSTGGKPVVDIAIDGLTFSNSDLEGVVYSVPYIDDFGYSLITSSTSSIKPGDNLDGLQIGILKNDSDVKAYATKAFPKATFVELSDATVGGQRDWINRAIKEGKVDGIIYDYPFGVAEIAGTNLQFAVTKLPGSDIKYKIGVRKADEQLLQAINMSIRKAKEDPQYSELIRKYFMATNTVAVKKVVSGESTYTVVKGDTLSTIAQAKMGDRMKYRSIEARNNLPNPNLIAVGQKLVIPAS